MKNSVKFRLLLFMLLLVPVLFSALIFTNQSQAKSQDGKQADPYLPFAQVMPEPVGGLEAVYKKISYPAIAKQAGLQGKVYLLVFVDEHGSVDDAKVVKDIGGGCGAAAAEAVKKIKFTPGKNGGAPVKVKLSMQIIFKLH